MIDMGAVLADLKRDEGLRLKPYRDSEGKLTIGIGRNLDDYGITAEEADYLALNNIQEVIGWLDTYPWFSRLGEVRSRALINMGFNLGPRRFATFKKMIAAFENGHYQRAALEALDSKWACQVGERAVRISRMIREG